MQLLNSPQTQLETDLTGQLLDALQDIVQKIEIKWFDDGKIKQVSVFIDGKIYGTVCYNFGVNVTELYKRKKLDLLAQNDGFETIEEFFAYFNEDFKGKMIHWTDLKY